MEDKNNHKPWSWADTYPVFKLSFPRIAEKSYVIAGSSGRNLAFSSAHLSNSGLPYENKTTIVSGHRDSHFSYLQDLIIGDTIIANSTNYPNKFRVVSIQIIDSSKHKLPIRKTNELILTIC